MPTFPPGATTLHLIPAEAWDRVEAKASYTPDAFESDGFVHCTDGNENLVAVGNRYYQGDPRPYLALTISIDKLTSPIRYDDAAAVFPHIYGPINRDAIIAKRRVLRGSRGEFIRIDDDETRP